MSNLRIFWIIWCSFWALFWLFSWWFTAFLGLLMVPVSLAAILIPVGCEPSDIRKPGEKRVADRYPNVPYVNREGKTVTRRNQTTEDVENQFKGE